MLAETRDDGYLLTDDRERIDLELVHHWLSTDSYWAAGVRRFPLVTKDAHEVYARLGFTDVQPGRWMECDLREGAVT